jgi:hypothetical protein
VSSLKVVPSPAFAARVGRRLAYLASPIGARTLSASMPPSKKTETRILSPCAAWAIPPSKADSGIFEAP